MPMPRPFDGFVEHAKRVSPTCLVHLERNRYSVPASFANRPVSLRVYPDRIVVVAEGGAICEHQRVFARPHDRQSRTVYDSDEEPDHDHWPVVARDSACPRLRLASCTSIFGITRPPTCADGP